MLSINNVTKKYGDFTVLKNINLELSQGVYGLLAPNGAGKTTLIKMLTTLLYPTEGEILWNGKNIIKMDEDYREILGYLPQNFGYYKNYTPKKYLLYLAALKGLKKDDARDSITNLLNLVGLEDVENKKMKKFSGGMIQRVGIAQAMLSDPEILILDEPTAGLDPKERVRFRNLISKLSRDRIVILSTHIVSDLESIANKIIMIKDGIIEHNNDIKGICEILKDKVYETYIDTQELDEFKIKNFILSEKQEEGKIKIRFITEQNQKINYKKVVPNLEDVFLYVYRDKDLKENGEAWV